MISMQAFMAISNEARQEVVESAGGISSRNTVLLIASEREIWPHHG